MLLTFCPRDWDTSTTHTHSSAHHLMGHPRHRHSRSGVAHAHPASSCAVAGNPSFGRDNLRYASHRSAGPQGIGLGLNTARPSASPNFRCPPPPRLQYRLEFYVSLRRRHRPGELAKRICERPCSSTTHLIDQSTREADTHRYVQEQSIKYNTI